MRRDCVRFDSPRDAVAYLEDRGFAYVEQIWAVSGDEPDFYRNDATGHVASIRVQLGTFYVQIV